jgi:flagellar basal-body rod modification protein FlgD
MEVTEASAAMDYAGLRGPGAATRSEEAGAVTPEELGLETGAPGGELGKDEFLELLTTQLTNQDPMDPVDNTEMIAQLAQFSALEQMQNLNTSFENFSAESQIQTAIGLTGMWSGERVKVFFRDGSTEWGDITKFYVENGEMLVQMGDKVYAMDDITGMRKPVDSELAELSGLTTTTEEN